MGSKSKEDDFIIHNESTPQTAISPYIAKKIVEDFMKSRSGSAVEDEHGVGVIEVDPVVFAQFVTWWVRSNGQGQDAPQVVRGWSKLRVNAKDIPLTDEQLDYIRQNGPKPPES